MTPRPDHAQAQTLKELLLGPIDLLSKKEKLVSLVILASIFLNSVIDLVGLALVIPVIGLVIRPETVQDNKWIAQAFESSQILGVDSLNQFVILLCILLVFVFIGKAVFSILINLFQARFSFSVGLRLCSMMWAYYFGSSLEELRRRETGLILTEVNGYPNAFASTFLIGNVKLISDIIMITLIIAGMIFYNPIVVLAVTALTIFCGSIVRLLTKKKLEEYSEMQRTRAPRSNSQINNAVKGFVEIFSFNAMDFVKQDYISNNRMLYRISANSGVLKQTPAKVYEVVAAISISGAIVVSILIGKTDESFLNLLIVLTLATYRIMPTVSRVNSQLLNLRNSWYILMSLKYSRDGLLTRDSAARPKQASLKKAEEVSIQLDNLTFKYADGDLVLNSLFSPLRTGNDPRYCRPIRIRKVNPAKRHARHARAQ